MSRTRSIEERLFYIQLCVHYRLSSRQLERQINAVLNERINTHSPNIADKR